MAPKFPFSFDEHVFVSVQGNTEQPLFFRLSLKRVHSILLMGLLSLTVLFLGSLFFFRELEINRKLNQRVLELETNGLLLSQRSYALLPPAIKMPAPVTAPVTAPATKAAPVVPAVPVVSPVPVVSLPTTAPPQSTSVSDEKASVSTRISDLFAECSEEYCDVKLNLAPSQQGIAQGQLLLVLELEVPRIGASTSQVRKKYLIYPGFGTQEELNPTKLQEMEKKPFRFSRGLSTGTTFKMGKLLEPLAINVYLFDENNNVVVHERRAIEREESDAP
jgi:hypothetical protein